MNPLDILASLNNISNFPGLFGSYTSYPFNIAYNSGGVTGDRNVLKYKLEQNQEFLITHFNFCLWSRTFSTANTPPFFDLHITFFVLEWNDIKLLEVPADINGNGVAPYLNTLAKQLNESIRPAAPDERYAQVCGTVPIFHKIGPSGILTIGVERQTALNLNWQIGGQVYGFNMKQEPIKQRRSR